MPRTTAAATTATTEADPAPSSSSSPMSSSASSSSRPSPVVFKRSLSYGTQGVTHRLPTGDVVRVDEHDYDSSNNHNHNHNTDDHDNEYTNRNTMDDNNTNNNGSELMIHDEVGRLQWSIKFFENLHMDLHPAQRDHLRTSIERLGRRKFEEYYKNSHPNDGDKEEAPPSLRKKMILPKTKVDPSWSPIVDVQEVSVPVVRRPQLNDDGNGDSHKRNNSHRITRRQNNNPSPTTENRRRSFQWPTTTTNATNTTTNGRTSPRRIGTTTTTTTTTPALTVIHRLAYEDNGEEVVMGRFLLPVRTGLYEIIVIAADDDGDKSGQNVCEEASNNDDNDEEEENDDDDDDQVPQLTMTFSSSMSSSPTNVAAAAAATTTVPTSSLSPPAKSVQGCRTSPEMDDKVWDDQYPDHCLTRVRRALRWLIDESAMTVNDPPKSYSGSNNNNAAAAAVAELNLSHLRCRIIPPPRFLPCPNPDNPESNKYRFCRATLGGTGGVEMMVVSCWYGAEQSVVKGNIKQLKKVAVHASKVIHESQQLFNIKITAKEIALGKYRQRLQSRWLSFPNMYHPKDAVITTVDCVDAQGHRKRNTIGWVRESISGRVYLVYFVDTLRSSSKDVVRELATTLASIRVPRLIPNAVRKKLAWHSTSSPALLQT